MRLILLCLSLFALSSAPVFSAAMVSLDPSGFMEDEHAQLRKRLVELVDYTKDTSDICPVHKIKMPAKDVPIRYGLDASEAYGIREKIDNEFPFSRDHIAGGCVVNPEPDFPTKGKRYVCPECVAAWSRFVEAARAKAVQGQSK